MMLAGWAGLAVASCVDGLDPNTRGMYAAAAAVALICPLAARGRGVSATLLATGPVRSLGEMSYGVYLWHWPVIIVLQRVFVLDNSRLFVAATAISVVLAFALAPADRTADHRLGPAAQVRHAPRTAVRDTRRADRRRDPDRARGAVLEHRPAGGCVAAGLQPRRRTW